MGRARGKQGLDNGRIAELLAIEGDSAKPPLQKAFRRASRRAFLWPEEASQLLRERRLLTELPGRAGADWLSTQECAKLFTPNQSSCERLGKDLEKKCVQARICSGNLNLQAHVYCLR
jgi:hypothetical protein